MRRRVVSIVILVVFFASLLSQSVLAYDKAKKEEAQSSGNTTDVASWAQGSVPNDGGRLLHGGTGSTVKSSACSYFGTSYMLVKMGELNPKTETPLNLIDKVDAIRGWEESWGLFNFKTINQIYPKVNVVDWKAGVDGLSYDKQVALIKGKMSEGLFVQLCVVGGVTNGHYIFVDGFDESGDMVIGDSGFQGTKWSDLYAGAGTRIVHMTTFSHSEKKVNDCPSIYSANLGVDMTEKEKEEYQKITKEWDLVGMPKSTFIEDGQNILDLPEDGLTRVEKKNVETIKEHKDIRELRWFEFARKVISFIGLGLIIYGILLLLAYIFDYMNVFVEVSLLGVISLGRFRLLEDDMDAHIGYSSEKRVTYLTRGMVLRHSGILICVGMVLVSGLIFDIIINIIYFIKDKVL